MPSNAFSALGLPPLPPFEISLKKEIIEHTRNLFAKNRDKVEEDIKKWSALEFVSSRTVSQVQPKTEYWEIICSRCQKSALVPFKPDPAKPIYCNECFALIKAKRQEGIVDGYKQLEPVEENKSECLETDHRDDVIIEQKRKEIKDKIDNSGLADTLRNIFKS